MANEEKCASSSSCGRSSCEGCPSANKGNAPVDFAAHLKPESTVKKVIGIVSGKGGVGKSLVTALMASAMQRRGHQAAVLDADITGPSMGKSFGLSCRAQGDENGIFPAETTTGVELITSNMFLPGDDNPVIWRGALISSMVKQFWTEVIWKDVDYMFVDMPPGTGDVPLTVFQSLPVDGIIIVTSPQDLVAMIVSKAVMMAQMMNIPILGLVENYAYFHCPDNGKDYKIFGESHIEETAKKYNLDILAHLPIDPAIAGACDAGLIETVELPQIDNICKYIEDNLH